MKTPESEKARLRKHYEQHKEETIARSKRWAAENLHRRREISRESRKRIYRMKPITAEQRVIESARSIAWYRANPERVRQRVAAWLEKNPEKREAKRISSMRWRHLNPDKCHAFKQARRARETLAKVDRVDRRIVMWLTNDHCGICGKPIESAKFHVDHIVPLSKGGLHSYANTQPAHPSCNLRKGNRVV